MKVNGESNCVLRSFHMGETYGIRNKIARIAISIQQTRNQSKRIYKIKLEDWRRSQRNLKQI